MGQVGDAEDEADGVEDVGFTRPIEAGDGIEVRIEAGCLHRGRMSTVLEADGGVGRKGKLMTPTGGEGKSQPISITHPAITVRWAYDLKPSTTISLICMVPARF